MTRTLDKSRPYGTIFGISEHGGVFQQDGCEFNNAGECVYEPPGAKKETPAAPQPTTTEAPAADLDRRAKLEALHATKVKALAVEMGIEPATGAGSKARNIEAILAAGG